MLVSLSILAIQDGKGRRSVEVFTSLETAQARRRAYLEANWAKTIVAPITGEEPMAVFSPRFEGEFAEIIDSCLVDVPMPVDGLFAEVLAFKAEAFENGRPINGEDLVHWFGQWRTRLRAVLAQPIGVAGKPAG